MIGAESDPTVGFAIAVTLLVVACLAIAVARFHEVKREIEVVVRNTPEPADVGLRDCPRCAELRAAAEVARLRALFNDTPKEDEA